MSKKKILQGIAASPGTVEGRVRVILTPDEADKMKEGEILVATETTPQCIVAILKASAIVTDAGGILSHPAIVSRELGIPGVVGTGEATKVLRDGMEVIVDGEKGIVFQKSS